MKRLNEMLSKLKKGGRLTPRANSPIAKISRKAVLPCRNRIRQVSWSTVGLLAGLLSHFFVLLVEPQTGWADGTEDAPPNVLIILADDMGFSDLGCYGGEIQTPHLDRLAQSGLRFSNFYNTGRCWPTRASLLTGFYAQQVRRDGIPGIEQSYPTGGRGRRPGWAKLLPERLESANYRSYHSGKWHIDGSPTQGGFDHYYRLNDHNRFFNPQRHVKDGEQLPPVDLEEDYYTTTAIASHAIQCLQNHAEDNESRPFFQFVAFTAPHFPLQALPEDARQYEGVYDAGWRAIRQARWERIQELNIDVSKLSQVERETGPPYHFPEDLELLGDGEVNRPLPWDELTSKQQEFQITKMELHAAMVHRMDIEIGRIFEQIQRMDAWDNTLIFFLSDNGASAEIMVRGDGHDHSARPGSAATFLCLGPGWSTTSNTPFRKHKTWVHEGGIATPLIAHWPARLAESDGWEHRPGHVIDIVPTILEASGVDASMSAAAPDFPGQDLFAPANSPARSSTDQSERTLWWSHEGHRALRHEDWKVVATKDGPWELYDLGSDRAETNDLSEKFPGRLKKLTRLWKTKARQFAEDAQPAN